MELLELRAGDFLFLAVETADERSLEGAVAFEFQFDVEGDEVTIDEEGEGLFLDRARGDRDLRRVAFHRIDDTRDFGACLVQCHSGDRGFIFDGQRPGTGEVCGSSGLGFYGCGLRIDGDTAQEGARFHGVDLSADGVESAAASGVGIEPDHDDTSGSGVPKMGDGIDPKVPGLRVASFSGSSGQISGGEGWLMSNQCESVFCASEAACSTVFLMNFRLFLLRRECPERCWRHLY